MCKVRVRRKARRGQRQAFTLIELLIVIAVIAILLALLMPSLNLAKELTRQMMCMSRLHALGTAFVAYESDWRVFPRNSNYQFTLGTDYANWVYCGSGGNVGNTGGNSEPAVRMGSLWSYMGGSYEAYVCPVERLPHHKYRSYSANMHIGTGGSAHMGAPYSTGAIRSSDITRSPSEVMVFMEEGRTLDDACLCYGSMFTSMPNYPVMRHYGNFTASFADGSVRPVPVLENRGPSGSESKKELEAVSLWMCSHLDMFSPKIEVGPYYPP